MRSLRNKAGFTLIEILVALSIMVIVLGAAYGTFTAATKSISRCRARKSLEEDGQGVLRMMAREIRCSYFPARGENRPASSTPGGTTAATGMSAGTGAPAVITAVSERPTPQYLNGSSGVRTGFLRLLTTAGITDPDQPSSGLYNVAYRLDSTKKMLFRRQADLLQPEQSDTDSPGEVCVARGVESLAYSFGDGKKWVDNWQTDGNTGLPSAVKIDVVLSDAEGNQRAFSTTVFVAMQAPPPTQTLIQPPSPGP